MAGQLGVPVLQFTCRGGIAYSPHRVQVRCSGLHFTGVPITLCYPLNILTRPQDSGWVGSFRAKCHPWERWDSRGLTHEPGSPRWTKPSFPLGTWSSWTEHPLERTLWVGFWLQLQEGALSVESPRQCKGGSFFFFFLRKMCSLPDVFHTHSFLSWVSILLDRGPPTVLRRNLSWRINHESGVCPDEGRVSRWDSYPPLVEGWRRSGSRRGRWAHWYLLPWLYPGKQRYWVSR